MKNRATSSSASGFGRRTVDIDGEYRELEEALRSLSSDARPSGAREATEVLTRLAGSRNLEIREDAQAILHAGRDRGWFDGASPSYADLSGIAWRSLEYHDSQRMRKRISYVLLIMLLFCFAAAVVFIGYDGVEAPELRRYIMALVAVVLVGIGVLLVVGRSRS